MTMFKPSFLIFTTAVALAACSEQPTTAPTAVSAVAHALSASDPVSTASPVAVSTPTAIAASVPQIADNATPKQQAQALHDLITQFKSEAAQRIASQQDRSKPPTQQRARELITAEIAAIRHDAERLKLLNLTDQEIASVRDQRIISMQLFAETAELQVQSSLAAEQQKNDELNQINQMLAMKIVQAQELRESAETNYQKLLKKYKIKS